MSFGIDGAHLPSGLPDPPAHNDGRHIGGRRSELRWKRTLFLGRSLRRLAHLLGGIKGRRSTERRRTEESGGVAALTRAGGRQAGHRSWSRRFRLGWLRMVAALAGAGAILAAAGALRAVLVVVAFLIRPVAPALVAPGALRAIPVVAALSADRALGVPVLAADQPVAAVELRRRRPGGGNELTAEVSRTLAAVVFRNAVVIAATDVSEHADDWMAFAIVTAKFAAVAVGVVTAFR